MKRRDFLSSGLTTLGAVSVGGRPIEGAPYRQNPTILAEIARERAGHPLFFDGMTFFNKANDDIRRAGLSGLLWDVSVAQMEGKRFVRKLNLCLKSIAAANAFLRRNDKGLFLATRGSQIAEAARSGKTAVFLQFQSAESISDDVDMLDVAYELGLRVLQFTHHHSNAYFPRRRGKDHGPKLGPGLHGIPGIDEPHRFAISSATVLASGVAALPKRTTPSEENCGFDSSHSFHRACDEDVAAFHSSGLPLSVRIGLQT